MDGATPYVIMHTTRDARSPPSGSSKCMCGVEECAPRDPKGMYAKANNGEVPALTGVLSPYEAPAGAELVVDTESKSVDEIVSEVLDHLKKSGIVMF